MNDTMCPMPYEDDEDYCFVSYAHLNKQAVYPIIAALMNRGVRIWYDRGIDVGEKYHDLIVEKISGCKCFIPFFSEQSLDTERSKFVTNECAIAYEQGAKILPVYLGRIMTLPGKLRLECGIQDLHSLVLNDDNYSAVAHELLKQIPAECKDLYKKNPYDEDMIDTSVRRCPVMIVYENLRDDSADAAPELNRAVYALAENSEASESVDIAVVGIRGGRPAVLNELSPVSHVDALITPPPSAPQTEALLSLAAEMLDNCVEFYADMGVSAFVPIVILVTSETGNGVSAYARLEAAAAEKRVLPIIIPITPCRREELSDFFKAYAAAGASGGEGGIAEQFGKTVDMILSHIGAARSKKVADASAKQADTEAEEKGKFRQRKLSEMNRRG